jgi:Ankyrin repeat
MNKPEYYPIELLHWAGMEDKHLLMIEEILDAHPEYINTMNNHKDNALMIAARLNNIEIVKYFLDKTDIDYKHVSSEGNFFMVALKYNQKTLVKALLENYRNKIDLSCKTAEGKTFLHLAAYRGFDFIFEDQDLCKDYIFKKDINQQTCLFDLFDGYVSHKNYWCFDLIQEYFSREQIDEKNIENMTIFQYFFQKKLIEFSTIKNPDTKKTLISEIAKENVIATYTPILNVLEQRV